MNTKEGNAALLEVPIGDLPILHRATTHFFRYAGFTTISDLVAMTSTDFAKALSLFYATTIVDPTNSLGDTAVLVTEQVRAVALWLTANNLYFAATPNSPPV